MIKLFCDETPIPVKFWKFPAGERGVKVEFCDTVKSANTQFIVDCVFSGSDDLIDLLLICDAIKTHCGNVSIFLQMKYFPYARQDHLSADGESISLRPIVQMILAAGFNRIEVWDPHSDVLESLFPPGKLNIVPQWKLHKALLHTNGFNPTTDVLVSPDAGASKKIYKTAEALGAQVIECSKRRDDKGKIVGCEIPSSFPYDQYKNFWICDDICDGGATFIALSVALSNAVPLNSTMNLLVTHGIFSAGVETLNIHFDKIMYVNDISNLT